MFQLGLAYIIQADREREMAERIRQRRLLKPELDTPPADRPAVRHADERTPRARARATGS
jgi:hypothetical protein